MALQADQTVSYAQQSAEQVMDIYQPASEHGRNPLLVLVHGGAFVFGNQKMPLIQPVIEKAVTLGYVVASVDYRKSSTAVFPAALADVKAAVRYLKAHAQELSIAVDDITIWGESAGAYLSLMTALTPCVDFLNGEVNEYLEETSFVNKLVTFYAPVEFYTMKEQYLSFGNETAGVGQFESAFLGIKDIYQDKAACDKSYWETYRHQLPADFKLKVMIQVGGEKDDKVPYLQSVQFAERLQTLEGVTLAFKQFKEAKHEDPIFYTEENLTEIFTYLKD